MKYLVALIILLVSLPAAALDLPDLAERTKPSVVLLTLKDDTGEKIATGSGFFVSSDGRIVTNFHVIRGGASVAAKLSDGREIPVAGVLAADETRDIAVLATATKGPFPALKLGDSSGVRPGEEVVVIGSPLGLSGTVSAGIVSAVRAKGLEDDEPPSAAIDETDEGPASTASWGIQITAAISPGSSGSPVMTSAGDVVGVAVGTRLGGQAMNFAVPIEVAKGMLASIAPNATPKPLAAAAKQGGASDVLRNLGISAAAILGVALVYVVGTRIAAWRERRRGPARVRTIRRR